MNILLNLGSKDVQNNILEYLIYPQPYLCPKGIEEIKDKSNLFFLNYLFSKNVSDFINNRNIHIILFKNEHQLVNFEINDDEQDFYYTIYFLFE